MSEKTTRSEEFLFYIILCFVIIGYSSTLATGKIGALGAQTVEDLQFSGPFEAILLGLYSFKWFVLPMAITLSFRTGQVRFKVFSLLIGAFILSEALITTGKGTVLTLLMIWVIHSGFSGRAISKRFIIFSIAVSITMVTYSYLARTFTAITHSKEKFSIESTLKSIETVWSFRDQGAEIAMPSILNRMNYLDGLALVMANNVSPANTPFAYGSAVELVMFVPRFLWPDRPYYNFNVYCTTDIFDMPFIQFSESPIGRIGESYLVLGVFGLVMATVYSWIFISIYRYLCIKNHTLFYTSLYVFTLVTLILPDAYFFYASRAFFFSVIQLLGLRFLCNTLVPR